MLEKYSAPDDKRRDLPQESEEETKFANLTAALEELPLPDMNRNKVLETATAIYKNAPMSEIRANLKDAASSMDLMNPNKARKLEQILQILEVQ